MKLLLTLIFIFGSTQYVNDDLTRRVISDDEYNYTFYISDKKSDNFKDYKEYFWFRSGKVHSSLGGINGKILHGKFTKAYKTNAIAEQGEFNKGLKIKSWKQWHMNGKISTILNWSNGLLSGNYKEFSEKGELIIKGKYKNHRKHGRWINYKTEDTLFYKRGEQVLEEELEEEEIEEENQKVHLWTKTKTFVKDLFRKKTPEEKEELKALKEKKKKEKELEKKQKELARKRKELEAKKSNQKKKKKPKKEKSAKKEKTDNKNKVSK